MLTKEDLFDEEKVFAKIKNYLPAQAPLKDFVQYNILYSFQNLQFNEALLLASKVFGYKVFYPLSKYRELYHTKAISSEILHLKIAESKGKEKEKEWLNKLLHGTYNEEIKPRIGTIRNLWKKQYKFDLDSMVQPTLFRILAGYLDQGVSIWSFPTGHKGLYAAIKDIERNSFLSIFKSTRTKALLFSNSTNCTDLLKILVGDSTLYEQYLFDQQFSHQGWSGLVSMVENFPNTLIDTRKISVKDIIYLELLLEIDALDQQFGTDWKPLNSFIKDKPDDLFKPVESTELHEVYSIWHSAFEWTYYDQVLSGLKAQKIDTEIKISRRFQGLFCIDDRECAFRRHLERAEPYCETYGTPGFFGVEFYFKPDHGKAYAKLCPAPVTPKHLIKEQGTIKRKRNDPHFNKHTHTLLGGFLMSNTIGFWSALKLFLNIFRPSMSQAVATSLRHMDKSSNLTIENTNIDHKENHLQIGYTLDEMIERADKLLKSIGLVNNFAPIVYIMGHGSSTVNNPHFAAYDCGACSSKPGSVNARVMAHILNNKRVRAGLKIKGIDIPDETDFVGGLHDTTLDEVTFFDEFLLSFDKTR
ncbi:MAG: putative inorganic carbon transporter subunit DabA, partial [Bacteroidota bacterium]|nr:putative inorganic carbon transporter subunit DabA [Bacteroidota bacterium]